MHIYLFIYIFIYLSIFIILPFVSQLYFRFLKLTGASLGLFFLFNIPTLLLAMSGTNLSNDSMMSLAKTTFGFVRLNLLCPWYISFSHNMYSYLYIYIYL